jgi:hypothetical protein
MMAKNPAEPKPPGRRPTKHTYIVKSTDPLIGFISAKHAPMIMPMRFTRRRRLGRGKTTQLTTLHDVRIFMQEIDNEPGRDIVQ